MHNVKLMDEARTLLSTMELSRYIGRSHTCIRNWRNQGILPRPLIINGRAHWERTDIDKWMDKQKRPESRKLTDDL